MCINKKEVINLQLELSIELFRCSPCRLQDNEAKFQFLVYAFKIYLGRTRVTPTT